jgi:hypothetical protein
MNHATIGRYFGHDIREMPVTDAQFKALLKSKQLADF